MSHVMNTYARQPVAFVRGEGVWLWDEAGKKYLDALAGIAVNTLGYAHPRLTRALTEQIGRLMHTSNLFRIPLQEAAADRLAETGSRKVQAGFEPLVSGFVRVPLNDLDAVRTLAEHNRNVAAVMVEPIQGEGGINVSRLDYLRGLKEICERREWLFISDEVQCGLGRSGKWFVYQHAGFLPDVVPLAKGLGSGVPVGACVVGGRARGVFKPGNHGSTFGGNPLAMTAVVTTIDSIKDDGLLANAARVGEAIRGGLAQALGGKSGVTEIRGMGLMIGLELERPCGEQ